MGLDGGTIISRSDVLRGQSWRVNQRDVSRSTRGGSVSTGPSGTNTTEQQAERVASWTTCTISGQPLSQPVVADDLGRLFNRNAVVEYLLAKKHDIFLDGERSVHQLANSMRTAPGAFNNLRSLKDVFPVHVISQELSEAEGASTSSTSKSVASGSVAAAPYCCPVTGLPCTRYPFSALRPCGHVISQRALTCASSNVLACPVCGNVYREDHVVLLNGSKEQLLESRAKLEAMRCKPRDGEPRSKKSKRSLPEENV